MSYLYNTYDIMILHQLNSNLFNYLYHLYQVLLDVEDDTGPALLRLLNMNLKTTTMAVKVRCVDPVRGKTY